ncbi:MAG: ABC transporter permease [Streptosporangiaceae bacterium]
MIGLSWRQFRAQAAVAFGLLAVIAVALSITGPALAHLYHTSVLPCQAQDDCSLVTSAFAGHDHLLQDLGTVLVVVPGLIGLFWGAPLAARELETGTYQLAWTQSVTRKRWLAVKLGVVGLASVAVAGLLSLMVTWWSSPIDRVNADPFTLFDQRGIVPLGYAAFAFALGVCAGLVLHRTVPAMAVTVAVFVGIRLSVTNWVRPDLFAPLQLVAGLKAPGGSGALGGGLAPPGAADWVVSDQVINAAGRVIGQDGAINLGGGRLGFAFGPAGNGKVALQGVGVCPNRFPASFGAGGGQGPSPAFVRATQECVSRLGLKDVLTYQPTYRYWPLQWIETGIFVGLALILAGFCFWWLRRRYA